MVLSLATHRYHDSTQPKTQTSPVAPLEASKLHGVCNRHSFPMAAEALGGFGGMFRRMSILILLIFISY